MIETGAAEPMNLYLLRHGIAEDRAASGRDEDRELTAEGEEKLSALLHRAARAGVKADALLTSPYKRALQTARLAARVLHTPEPVLSPALVPHSSPRDLWNAVREQSGAADVLLSSHEPLLSASLAYLLNAPTLQVEIKKGALVALEFESLRGEPRGTLRWLLTPKLCAE